MAEESLRNKFTLVVRDPVEDILKKSQRWVSSPFPLPIPRVGEEIDIGGEAYPEVKQVRRPVVVTRVIHWVQWTTEGLDHRVELFTKNRDDEPLPSTSA